MEGVMSSLAAVVRNEADPAGAPRPYSTSASFL